nr:copia protein [Tanacetum cinerariifolium]
MNYKPVVAENQSNGSAGKARVKKVPIKDYILLPLCTQDPLFFFSSKDSSGDGFKPSGEEEKKDAEDPRNEDNEVLSTKEPRVNQEKEANVSSTNNINIVSPTTNVASIKDNAVNKNIVYRCADDPNMPNLEKIVYSDDDEDVGAEADMNNLDTNIPVNPIATTKIHKDHPDEQIIRDIHATPQTRRMTKSVTDHADLPYDKRAIRTKWIYKNKKDKRGIVVRNKARLVAQGYTQEERIDYDEVFALVARIKAIRLFLAYASFKDFVVYQMDVKNAFLYGNIKEKVYVYQPPGFEDSEFPDRVYKTASTPMETLKPLMKDENAEDVDVHLYRSMIGSLIIFKYLKGQPKLGLWYPKDSPFDLKAYTDSDYAGASLDRKSTTGGCQFLRSRLILWQCKKQTVIANSTTEAEYIAASNYYGQAYTYYCQLKVNADRHKLTTTVDVNALEGKIIIVILVRDICPCRKVFIKQLNRNGGHESHLKSIEKSDGWQ